MNPTDVSDPLEAPKPEEPLPQPGVPPQAAPAPVALSPFSLNPAFLNPAWLRLAYALEFLIALIAIISLWSEIGGEGHLDLMPWYVKLGCILALAWCCVRFTAGVVEQQKVWTRRTIGWFTAILLVCIAMGGITYYYHLHEEPEDDGDEDTTAAAVSIQSRGNFSYHASTRTRPSIRICLLARRADPTGHRISVGGNGRDSRLRLR